LSVAGRHQAAAGRRPRHACRRSHRATNRPRADVLRPCTARRTGCPAARPRTRRAPAPTTPEAGARRVRRGVGATRLHYGAIRRAWVCCLNGVTMFLKHRYRPGAARHTPHQHSRPRAGTRVRPCRRQGRASARTGQQDAQRVGGGRSFSQRAAYLTGASENTDGSNGLLHRRACGTGSYLTPCATMSRYRRRPLPCT